jgi:hypothetical protein
MRVRAKDTSNFLAGNKNNSFMFSFDFLKKTKRKL